MAPSSLLSGPHPWGHPVRDAFTQVPAVCFTLTLLTDVAYARTGNLLWVNFSSWLLLAGMVGGGLAALATVVGLVVHRDEPWRRAGWPFLLGGLGVLALGLVNNLVHARDGWTAVVPLGLLMSLATVALMLAVAVLEPLVARDRLGRARR